jgi:hypothetical protein
MDIHCHMYMVMEMDADIFSQILIFTLNFLQSNVRNLQGIEQNL